MQNYNQTKIAICPHCNGKGTLSKPQFTSHSRGTEWVDEKCGLCLGDGRVTMEITYTALPSTQNAKL